MNSSTVHPTRPFSKKWQRVLLRLFAIAVVLTMFFPAARPTHAASDSCITIGNTTICPDYTPPGLLHLSGLYAATPAQSDALQDLEDQAVANTIADHDLAATDGNAVKSWGRDTAEAELFALLVQAIQTPAASRTASQEAAVDWVSAVEQRQAEQAAQDAGLEYAKWAGLDQNTYWSLIYANASQSTLQTFLSGPVLTYNNTNTSLADGGYCVYRSPTPYASEYTGYTDPTCYAPCLSILGCKPPTPTYDQFVKWGEADATYAFLNSKQYVYAASSIALDAGGFFGALAGAAAVGAITSQALATSQVLLNSAFQNAVFPYLERKIAQALSSRIVSATVEVVTEAVAATLASAVGFIVGVVIDAVVTAVLEGIDVGNAAALPGKLATLIVNARTTTVEPASLLADTNGAASLYSLFVGATLPSPMNETCDNTNPSTQPGLTVISGQITVLNAIPCLNPTPIPPATNTDPTFVIQAKGATTQTSASTITWVDTASQTTTTARLSGNWFIVQANGSSSWVQTLRIPYTDWDGKEQIAWLLGSPTDGYHFVSFVVSDGTALNSSTCIANGTCSYSTSINYIGADGQQYSATVRGYQAPTGTPTYSSAVEASPVSFDANKFAPGGAVGGITHQWRFQKAGCGIPCISTVTLGPAYTDPVSGPTASYTWQTGGAYWVELKAIDAAGAEATTAFQVKVASLPPTLSLSPDCSVSSAPCNQWTGETGTSMSLGGTVGHIGTLDNVIVSVNWGDGSIKDVANAGPNSLSLVGNPLTLTAASNNLSFTLAGTHTYAQPGIYYGTVSVADWNGTTDSRTFVMTIKGRQVITFPAISGHSYGDVFTISATGGDSGQPVAFSSTSACALSNMSAGAGTGSATVTVLGAGLCDITASQAGTATYNPAPSVTHRFFILLAVLTVTASSPTITYGEAAPAIMPAYSGFVNGDGLTTLTSPATCAVAPNSGAAGTYAITCSGTAAPNYSTSYVPGTLTINPAPLTITANNKTMTYGGAVPSFDAQFGGLLNTDTGAVVSGLSCVAKDAGGQDVGSSTPVDSYPISCGGGSAANYRLSYVAGTLTIDKASTSTALSSSASPAVYGQPVTFTAAVAVNSPGSGHPGGTVAFKDGGSDIAGCAARPVDASTGTATCTTAALGVAQHGVTASYSGDTNFVGSSTGSALPQTVNEAAVTTTLGASASPSTAGQSVTFSVTVAAAAPGAGVPTGSVTFKDGATTLGTGTLSTSNGTIVASFTTSGLGVGQHSITASYSGDGNFLAASAAPLTQYVNTSLSGYPKLPSGAYNLSNKNLVGGYFVNAALAGASLSGSNLTSAVFLGTNLTGANLTSANLKGANLTGANLTGTNLTGATLKGATGLKTATLTNIIWNKTTCPDGTISNNNGGNCIGHL